MTRAPRKPDIEHPGETDMFPRHRPSYSAYCKHCMKVRRRADTINALHRGFREFGYVDLTIQETSDAYDIALTRTPEATDGIIAMLIRSQLEQAGIVGGDEDERVSTL